MVGGAEERENPKRWSARVMKEIFRDGGIFAIQYRRRRRRKRRTGDLDNGFFYHLILRSAPYRRKAGHPQ